MSLRSNPDLRDSKHGGDLSTTNYVWYINNINASMYVFSRLETLPKAPVKSGTISVLTLYSVLITLAKSIYLLTFSFSLLTGF